MKNKLFLSIIFSNFLVNFVNTSLEFDTSCYEEEPRNHHTHFDVFKDDMIKYFKVDINYARNNCRFFQYVSKEMIFYKIIFSVKELAYYVTGEYTGDVRKCKGLWLVKDDIKLLVLLTKYIGADKIRKDCSLIQDNIKKILLQTEIDQIDGQKYIENFLFNNDKEMIREYLKSLDVNNKDINDIMKIFDRRVE